MSLVRRAGPTQPDPVAIARERLAKGEITVEEFERIRAVLAQK